MIYHLVVSFAKLYEIRRKTQKKSDFRGQTMCQGLCSQPLGGFKLVAQLSSREENHRQTPPISGHQQFADVPMTRLLQTKQMAGHAGLDM